MSATTTHGPNTIAAIRARENALAERLYATWHENIYARPYEQLTDMEQAKWRRLARVAIWETAA